MQEGYIHRIERSVTFTGPLSDEQRTRLQEIAHKCPVHKTLTAPIVVTEWKEATLEDEDALKDEEALKDSDAGNFFES